MKKSGLVGVGAGIGAGTASVLSGGTVAPIAGAIAGGFVTDAATEIGSSPAAKIINKAPDNIYTLVQKAVEMLGFGLLALFLAPMILGWILPGPLERKQKGKRK